MTGHPPRAGRVGLVIFDCDGVLIDSEAVASRVVAAELTALGWPMTTDQAMARFIGMSIVEMVPIIETRLGRRLAEGWRAELAAKLIGALGEECREVPGAKAMLERMEAAGHEWRIASNSSGAELAVKFALTGMAALTAGRAFSATDMIAAGRRPKPAPDVYLAAAADADVAPAACLVLEDSALGVAGGVAAGMMTYGFAPHGDGALLRAAGACRVLRDFASLFDILEAT